MSIHTRFPFLVISHMVEENRHSIAAAQSMVLVENSTLHEAEYRIRFMYLGDCLRVVRLYEVPENFDTPKHIKVEVK